MSTTDFDAAFAALTDTPGPFPWQRELYHRFVSDRADNIPSSCNLPTGLGKTSVIAIWLIALAKFPDRMPRRLVYVVNRRTVVDQTTDEAEKLRKNLAEMSELKQLRDQLGQLALSTLRGQFADNREWSADPSRPAVIVGTVDMIGSRLLFSGYNVGFKGRPLHAGFLGQDVLLVHDEAHLEPAFQELLVAIDDEQRRCNEFRSFRVMELSATSRGSGIPFTLTQEDLRNPVVRKRITAIKRMHLHELGDDDKVGEELATFALAHKDSGRAVVVFSRKIEDVEKIVGKLNNEKQQFQGLTGTRRGLERDALVKHPIFVRFLPSSNRPEGVTPADGTVYLICTSAGEVGVNISADHLVCDLATFESMAQRFGRVNRFGDRNDTEIQVVHPKEFDDNELDQRRLRTLKLLRDLNGDGSPNALGELNQGDRFAAYAPTPAILPVSDILFDSWALTTIRGKLPGRPPVEPYLHGISDWEPPETRVAWREEVGYITPALLDQYNPEDLLEDYPLKPHELLRDRSDRVLKHLAAIAERHPHNWAWLIDDHGAVEPVTLTELADKDQKNRIQHRTILLPPDVGGLNDGFLDGKSEMGNDVGDDWRSENGERRRARVWKGDERFNEKTKGMRLIRRLDFAPVEDEEGEDRTWYWYEMPATGDSDGSRSNERPVTWLIHTNDVTNNATEIVRRLPFLDELKDAVILAAKFHDLGKRRKLFQRILGNSSPTLLLSKSGKNGSRIPERYRHEFGSLLDVHSEPEFQGLSLHLQDLVLHLVGCHHGRGRPHFPPEEVFDPEPNGQICSQIAIDVPQRFVRLQRKYGRWGLAYLESLLRAADYAASANPSEFADSEDAQS